MKARFIRHVGTRVDLRVYWDDIVVSAVEPCDQCPEGHPTYEYQDSCPSAWGSGKSGTHDARSRLADVPLGEERDFGTPDDHPDERWPKACDSCGANTPPRGTPRPHDLGARGVYAHYQVFDKKLYDTASGDPEPGDLYWRTGWHGPGECPFWDNCDGQHLVGVLPNGSEWDVDSRASNCTRWEDRNHRCWVRRGSPEGGDVDVGKGGDTCSAGAGSIAVTGWHGFLRNGVWVAC